MERKKEWSCGVAIATSTDLLPKPNLIEASNVQGRGKVRSAYGTGSPGLPLEARMDIPMPSSPRLAASEAALIFLNPETSGVQGILKGIHSLIAHC